MEKIKLCCICGSIITGWGNNPWPVVKDEDAECCAICNDTVVLTARFKQMFGGNDDEQDNV